jgi:hypothetical protein
MNRTFKLSLLPLALLAAGFTAGAPAWQDEEEDAERKIWNKQISDARKKAGTNAAPPPGRPRSRAAGDDLVGVTVWRLQPASNPASARDEEDRPRLLVQAGGNTPTPMAPLRVASSTQFSKNDAVRLSIEVPREGENYLYVIDREIYRNGRLSDPYLIFPTTRVRGGDNKVMGGRIVDLPAPTDDPPFFNFNNQIVANPDYVGEQLTIIVSPTPLDTPAIGPDPVPMDNRKVAEWEKRWGGPADLKESRALLGKAWTKEEKESAEGKRLLTQGPLPQTIYRMTPKADGILLFTLSMRIDP